MRRRVVRLDQSIAVFATVALAVGLPGASTGRRSNRPAVGVGGATDVLMIMARLVAPAAATMSRLSSSIGPPSMLTSKTRCPRGGRGTETCRGPKHAPGCDR
jgi:hypothetical protein